MKLLAAGKADMAISYEPELLLARDQGLRLVSIGALVQRPLTSIIAIRGAHVAKVADLAGKTVGTAGIAYQSAELETALQTAGVSPSKVREVNVGFNLVPAMLSGKVAATLGGFWNYEAIQLRRLHKQPVTIPVDRAGVPPYDELVLVVRADEARTRGQDLRAFLQALTRGEREVSADPAAAATLVVKANPSLDPKLQLASIEQTLPAARPGGAGQALRLAGTLLVGVVRELDVRSQAARARPQRGAAAVDQRVPAGSGNLSRANAAAPLIETVRRHQKRGAQMRIGVLTGGGDCPGLNAVIRAVVRRGTRGGHSFLGFRHGWAGVLADEAGRAHAREHRRDPARAAERSLAHRARTPTRTASMGQRPCARRSRHAVSTR